MTNLENNSKKENNNASNPGNTSTVAPGGRGQRKGKRGSRTLTERVKNQDTPDSSQQQENGSPSSRRKGKGRMQSNQETVPEQVASSNGAATNVTNAQNKVVSIKLSSGLSVSLKKTSVSQDARNDTIPHAESSKNSSKNSRPKSGRRELIPLTDRTQSQDNTASSKSSSRKDQPRKQSPIRDTNLNLMESLIQHLSSESYECMICYDPIRVKEAIWSCETCFAAFHLKCVKKWASQMQKDNTQGPTQSQTSWRCPGCQSEYDDHPNLYKCFCGKTSDPQEARLSCPHTCGQTCAKTKQCPHPCMLLCHPGPCPPCTFVGEPLPCYCGRHKLVKPCGELNTGTGSTPLTCGEICGKMLSCGSHVCEDRCHPGPCSDCSVINTISCYCSKNNKTVPCGSSEVSFGCGDVCGFQYNCREHICQKPCHASPHDTVNGETCLYDPSNIKTCPCGKSPISLLLSNGRSKCTDLIPTCSSTCDRKLNCGHTCQQSCHVGDCSPCKTPVESPCQCGAENIQYICHEKESDPATGIMIVKCGRVCNQRLSCRRHRCTDTCCIKSTQDHACRSLCGRKLSCGKHTCLMACSHEGKCHDCIEGVSFDELTCACGRSVIYPPIPCNTPLPKCGFPCTRERSCGHPFLSYHHCHPESEPCPPCSIFVPRSCACGAKIIPNVPCSRQGNPSCGSPCKGSRSGCSHPCTRVCHEGPCDDASHPCTQKCDRERILCGHICRYPCHGTSTCPENQECKHVVIQTCACGFRKAQKMCRAMRTNEGDVASPGSKNEVLECDETCARHARNVKLASALGLESRIQSADGQAAEMTSLPETPQQLHYATLVPGIYTETLVLNASKHRDLLKETEGILAGMVADVTKLYQYFPRLKSASQNRLISELATSYGFLAEIVDADRKKGNVIVRRLPNRFPKVPRPLLSAVLDPLLQFVSQPGALGTEGQSYTGLKISEFDAFVPDRILLRGMIDCMDETQFISIIRPIFESANMAGYIRWLSDSDCSLRIQRAVSWPSLLTQQEMLSNIADQLNVLLVVELMLVESIDECQAANNAGTTLRLSDGMLLNYRSSASSNSRVNSSKTPTSDGWTSAKTSKVAEVPILLDSSIPAGNKSWF